MYWKYFCCNSSIRIAYKWHHSRISLRISQTWTTQTAGARNKGGNIIGQLCISVVPHCESVCTSLMYCVCHTKSLPFRGQVKLRKGEEVLMGLLPFYHIYGLMVLQFLSLTTGSKVIVHPRFDPETFLKSIQEYRVSIIRIYVRCKNTVKPLLNQTPSGPCIMSNLERVLLLRVKLKPHAMFCMESPV